MHWVALALSGLYDLEPLQYVQVNEWMTFTPEEIRENSPARLIPKRTAAHLLASVGGMETDEFKRQTREYAERWKRAGHAAQLIARSEHNHFDLARSLVEPQGVLVSALHASITAFEK